MTDAFYGPANTSLLHDVILASDIISFFVQFPLRDVSLMAGRVVPGAEHVTYFKPGIVHWAVCKGVRQM